MAWRKPGYVIKHGFDAVFLAVGAQQSRRISLEGSFMPDVLHGMEFLRWIAEGQLIHNIFKSTVKCPAVVQTIWMICFN